MRFTKMQGLGNDYIYIWGEPPARVGQISQKLSDRHFGVGSDGLIFISPSDVADFKMRVFNVDGSEAKMCGNGIRCVGKYVFDKGYTDKTQLKIETLSGVKTLRVHVVGDKVQFVTVDMGAAKLENDKILHLESIKKTVTCTPVSMGNPHAVVFCDDVAGEELALLGREIEHSDSFPDGVNVELVQVLTDTRLRMRVWERGSGVTMACGTGACAAVAAAVSKGKCRKQTPVTVCLDGGELEISVDSDNGVIMTGEAVTVFEGELD